MIENLQMSNGDIDRSVQIMREVAEWCEATGKNMWKIEELTKDSLRPGLTAENFYVAQINGENAATMILQWQDSKFWPEIKTDESGFIHKLCVLRKYAGRGLSGQMIAFAIAECKKRNISYLRLDTGYHRQPLRRLYEGLGFVNAGRKAIGDREYALYEMKISPL